MTVRRLADVYSALDAAPTAALHAQARQLEGELLLTPAARKRAHVHLPSEEQPVAAVPAEIPERWRRTGTRLDPAVGTEEDPRRVLEDWRAAGG